MPITLPPEYKPYETDESRHPFLKELGVTLDLCLRHKVGFCETGEYANNIIVPLFNLAGELVSFATRWPEHWHPDGKVVWRSPLSPMAQGTLFNHVYAAKHDSIVIVEGFFDAVRVGEHAVALISARCGAPQLALLTELGQTRRLTVMHDADVPHVGRALATSLAAMCPDVHLVRTPPGHKHDPSACTTEELAEAVAAAVRIVA